MLTNMQNDYCDKQLLNNHRGHRCLFAVYITEKVMILSAFSFLLIFFSSSVFPLLGASETNSLIQHLEFVQTANKSTYGLRDNKGMGMDCLKVFQPARYSGGKVMGVYHSRNGSVFSIHLAWSSNLIEWTHVAVLDKNASQATIWQCDNEAFLIAYEKDAPNSCWIRFRYYETLSSLVSGNHKKEFDIERTLAPTAEGTPSLESVVLERNRIDSSEIQIRFHYFKNARVDQLAFGTLSNFKTWKSKSSDMVNLELIKRGWKGNLGDRDRFIWQEDVYYLQEVQRTRNDWSSWRICLCRGDGMPIRTLKIKTHKGSVAFANPNTTWITDPEDKRKLVITLFLPSEGNNPNERGTLLYLIDPATTNAFPKAIGEPVP